MRNWQAKTDQNDFICEEDINWIYIKDRVKHLQLNNNGQIIKLPEDMQYVQGKTASSYLGSGKVEVCSRYVGFYLGNNIIKVRVDEKTNNISIEVEDCDNDISDRERNEDSN